MTIKRPSFTDQEALDFHAQADARQNLDDADKANADAKRSVFGLQPRGGCSG